MEYKKTAVVTGGNQGIGKGICQMLLKEGYEVHFLARNDQRTEEFLKEENNPLLNGHHCDVSVPEEINSVCEKILKETGTVSVLVNNAGIQTHALFTDMTAETWNQLININLNSLFYVSKCFVPAMIEQGFGRIVNMSSMSAVRGSGRHVHYCTAKAGIQGFTRALSYEIARYGVTVNAICPGTVETEILGDYIEAKRDEWLSQMHVKRLGKPEDIANTIRFLINEDSGWITGQSIHVNGGILTP